jgi:hypothetical protein
MNLDERAINGLPPHLPFHPIVGHEEKYLNYRTGSIKMRLAALLRRIFTH